MKIIDHLKKTDKTQFSLEILPPKKGDNIQELFDHIDPLMEFKPPFIDVTYHREEYVYK
ncbi:MAG: methylenetetrahydrofolate reductase, partial [Cyclobacteriaceae bacterium]|nr:methylenetetrahydrofolate reductase [Cyclobacteriaceae bacterium]